MENNDCENQVKAMRSCLNINCPVKYKVFNTHHTQCVICSFILREETTSELPEFLKDLFK